MEKHTQEIKRLKSSGKEPPSENGSIDLTGRGVYDFPGPVVDKSGV